MIGGNVTVIFLILRNSIYLLYLSDIYITLTSEIMGWDKHVFLVSGFGVEFSQCWEQTLNVVMSVYKCSLGTVTSTAYFKGEHWQHSNDKQQFTLTGNFFLFSSYTFMVWSMYSQAFFSAQSVAVNTPVTVCLWSDIFHWRRLFHPVILLFFSCTRSDTVTAWYQLYTEGR